MTRQVDVVRRVLELTEGWPVQFLVMYGPNPCGMVGYNLYGIIVGLDDDTRDAEALRGSLEASFPGEVRAWVAGRTRWESMVESLDTVILEGFQQGMVVVDHGEWRKIAARLQGLADRGQIFKTRFGWRRPGDRAKDPDAAMLARLIGELRKRR